MSTNNIPAFLPELTLEQIKAGLRQTFPSLMPAVSQLKLLNDGFSSSVILVGNEFVLRIAKHAQALAGHRKEQAVLPVLQKQLPIEVPQPIWRAEPSDIFPFGVLGYRTISGIPFSLSLAPHVELQRIAQEIAGFLVALHDVPLAEMSGLDLRVNGELKGLWGEVESTLHAHLSEEEYKTVKMWWERYLNDPRKDSYTPKLIHGDPWGENIILNETLNGVAGVVDFETVCIGDVAQDFAALKYLGPDFSRGVLAHYQESGGELENHFAIRLQGWSMLRELRGLQYALRYPESGELADSLDKVRQELSLSV